MWCTASGYCIPFDYIVVDVPIAIPPRDMLFELFSLKGEPGKIILLCFCIATPYNLQHMGLNTRDSGLQLNI